MLCHGMSSTMVCHDLCFLRYVMNYGMLLYIMNYVVLFVKCGNMWFERQTHIPSGLPEEYHILFKRSTNRKKIHVCIF